METNKVDPELEGANELGFCLYNYHKEFNWDMGDKDQQDFGVWTINDDGCAYSHDDPNEPDKPI